MSARCHLQHETSFISMTKKGERCGTYIWVRSCCGSLTHDEEANERHKGVGVALPVDVDHQINIANAVGKFIDGLPVSGREHSLWKLVVDEEDKCYGNAVEKDVGGGERSGPEEEQNH